MNTIKRILTAIVLVTLIYSCQKDLKPSLTIDKSNLLFSETIENEISEPQSLKLTGKDLSKSIEINVSDNFQITRDNNYTSTLTISKENANGEYDIYVRFAPTQSSVDILEGTITISSTEFDDKIINLKGSATRLKSLYENGVYVLNEGPFQMGVGSISLYAPDSNKVYQSAYQSVNNGRDLGSILQSMNVIKDKAYFVANVGGKITVADARTLEYQEEITGLNQPRYIVSGGNDNLYVSQWGNTGTDGAIQVIDANTNTITKTIKTGYGPEGLIYNNNKLYVARSGGYDRNAYLLIMDPTSDTKYDSLEIGDNPTDIVLDKNGSIWVLCKGHSDWSTPANNTKGKLVKIDNDKISTTYDILNGSHDLTISPNGEELYFLTGQGVYKQSITETFDSQNLVFEGFFYAMGIHPKNGDIYVSDAKDYNSDGQVSIYNVAGTKISTFDVGIIPGSFYFRQ